MSSFSFCPLKKSFYFVASNLLMKKTFVALAILFFSFGASAQVKECSSVRNGKFKIMMEGTESFIERKGSLQIETEPKSGFKGEFKITWLNDCTYTIQAVKIHNKGNLPEIDYELILTTKIIRVEQDYYLTETTSNKWDMVFEAKVYKVK